MSKVNTDAIKPRDTGLDITLGATGDTTVISADSIDVNTVKDSGGNTLWSSDGAGTLSSVNSQLKGSEVLLSTNTFSGTTTSNFTTKITSAYNVYIFRYNAINPETDDVQFTFQASIDGGSNYNVTMTTTAFRQYHYEDDTAATLNYQGSDDQGQGTAYQILTDRAGSGADECGAGEIHLFNPASTVYIKHFYTTSQYYRVTQDGSEEEYIGGYFNTTSAINAISFKMSSGNMDGKIRMYGMSTT